LSNNLDEVKLLVANHPSTLSERNIFGHTPLHLAANKPSILRVLVEAADTALINQTDESDYSALEFAVSLSGLSCEEHMWKCRRCRCAECAVILLKADCAIPVSSHLQIVLSNASERCKLRYVRYMKERRDRLKQLALNNLSRTDIESLGLESEHVLDSNAPEVTRLLKESDICVPAALVISRYKWCSDPFSVYKELSSTDDADMFFRVGFRNTGSWYDYDDLRLLSISRDPNLPYLRWLTEHGGIYCHLPFSSAKDIFGSRCIFEAIGSDIKNSWTRRCIRLDQSDESGNNYSLIAPPALDREIAWLHEVHAAVFAANAVDACRCQCSPGGCTMLTFLLRELAPDYNFVYEPRRFLHDSDDLENSTLNSTGSSEGIAIYGNPLLLLDLIDGLIIYLRHFSRHLQVWHHYATLRYITYTALGICHSCCGADQEDRIFDDDLNSVEDGVEDDQGHNLALLEDLLNEFEENVTSILEDPDKGIDDLINFWERTWVGRMSEVLDRLEGSDLPEDERRGAEEIGVVWNKLGPEPPGEMGNPYRNSTIEFWLYELRKIEEECQ
jgi:hypothetical protein